jgi:hypothetical protein
MQNNSMPENQKKFLLPKTIYDLKDRPIATLDLNNDLSICLYNGHTVAWITNGTILAGWNGNTLGQVIGDNILNRAGDLIGTIGSKRFSNPPYRPISPYPPRIKKPFALGKAQATPQNPALDPNSLEEVLRSGGTYKIPPLKFPSEPTESSDQP